MRCRSLFEKHDHGVADVQAHVAAVVVRDGVTTLFDHKAMPVPVVTSVKFLFDFSCYVREMRWVVIFEGLQSGYNGVLHPFRRHIGSLNQHLLVCGVSKGFKCALVVGGND